MSDVITLPPEIEAGADREVQTLFSDTFRRVVLIRLRNRALLAAHSAVTPITIQGLLGSGELRIGEKTHALTAGVLVPVDAHVEHSVQADPAVALLVTFFRQPKGDKSDDLQARQRAEEALREVEERYRALVDNARDVVFTLTPDGVFTSLNAVFEEAIGWPPEEWIGKSFVSLIHADDLPAALDLWRRTLQGEAPPLFEVRLAPRQGEAVDAEILIAPRMQDGQVVSVLGIARNVTERNRAAEERRRAEIAEAGQKVLEKEIAERKHLEEQLRYRLAIEEALARASRLFVSDVHPDFTEVLKILGQAVGVDRAYIFLASPEGKTISNTHEWCADSAESWQSRLQELHPEEFPWLRAKLETGEPVVITDIALLPDEAKNEKALSRLQHVQAFLAVPIQSRTGRTMGFLGFEEVHKSRSWSEEDIRLLRVASEMLSNYLARKRAEDRLRAAEQDYRGIFENAVEGIYRSSFAGHQLRANPALVGLNGYSSEEEMLGAVNDIATEWYVEPHRREEFKRILEETGTVTNFESEVYRHKTRERIWIAETARLVRDEKGAPLYYEGTVQDITARKHTELTLREREARLAAIFRTVSDVIVTFDLNHVITGVNRAVERVLGYKPEEVIGQLTDMLATPESAAFARARTAQALRGEALPPLFEVEGVHKNGERIPLEASASFLYESGRPSGMVGVLRDITLKKELERQRADFLAMLTHDIKNPMHVILGCAELLFEDAVDETQRQLLQRLRGNALTVHSLVTNYLDLSKIESGHLVLARQPLSINILLRRIEQQYAGEAVRRNLTLHVRLQEDLPPVDGDPIALERVFANLLHNALKFTPQFGHITIHSTSQADNVAVVIADSGPGIAHEELALLFDKYHQTGQARTSDGAGLGLFIVKALVEAHGGRVEVESAPGQWTRFSVLLPTASLAAFARL